MYGPLLHATLIYLKVQQLAQQLQHIQKAQEQTSHQQQQTHHQHQLNQAMPSGSQMSHVAQNPTTPPNNHNIPANLRSPNTPVSGIRTPQQMNTQARLLEAISDETQPKLEELEQFAKTFKQRRIKLGRLIEVLRIEIINKTTMTEQEMFPKKTKIQLKKHILRLIFTKLAKSKLEEFASMFTNFTGRSENLPKCSSKRCFISLKYRKSLSCF